MAAAVAEVVSTVIKVVPEPVTVVGLNLALAPLGTPLVVKETAPLKPPEPVIVTV